MVKNKLFRILFFNTPIKVIVVNGYTHIILIVNSSIGCWIKSIICSVHIVMYYVVAAVFNLVVRILAGIIDSSCNSYTKLLIRIAIQKEGIGCNVWINSRI